MCAKIHSLQEFIILSNQINMILFEESIKLKYTAKNYNSHLNQFIRFMRIDSVDTLLPYSSSELQYELEDYLIPLYP